MMELNGHVEPAKQAVKFHRLDRADATSYGLWPTFEKRVRSFLKRLSPEFEQYRVENLVQEMFARWANTPQWAGYALIIKGDTLLSQQIIGHICAWIQVSYGKPYVLLFQVECEDANLTKEALRMGMGVLAAWKTAANERLRKDNPEAPLIDEVEHWTIHNPEAMERLLPEIGQTKKFSVMRFKI